MAQSTAVRMARCLILVSAPLVTANGAQQAEPSRLIRSWAGKILR